jgi:hypothetical protein
VELDGTCQKKVGKKGEESEPSFVPVIWRVAGLHIGDINQENQEISERAVREDGG